MQKRVTGQLDRLVSILRSQALGSNSLASETVFWEGQIFSHLQIHGSTIQAQPACSVGASFGMLLVLPL